MSVAPGRSHRHSRIPAGAGSNLLAHTTAGPGPVVDSAPAVQWPKGILAVGMTPEWKVAVKTGDIVGLAHALVKSGADINARDEHGQTGLMIAPRVTARRGPFSAG